MTPHLSARPFLIGAATVLLAGVASTPAGAQDRPRRGDTRKDVVTERLREGAPARTTLFALSRRPGGVAMVDVFVRGPGAEAQTRARGGEVFSRAGGWVTARVPLTEVAALSRASGVTGVEASSYAEPLDDLSKIEIGATQVRQFGANGQWQGATGRGAIVGVVDSGIDFAHPDFFDDDVGLSRILYLWDQTLEGPGPGVVGNGQFAYGVECPRPTLGPKGSCASRDPDGHGTHVAGTAAGDGSASRRGASTYTFTGVAPGAELIVVKTTFSFTSVVDGVNYIFRRAEQLGRPAVVNLSLGTVLGPHDGQSAMSLMIDALSGAGKVVVAAAGNEGRNLNRPPSTTFPFMHGDTVVAGTDSAEIRFEIPNYTRSGGQFNDLLFIGIYYPPEADLTVSVVRPNGTRVVVPFVPLDSVVSQNTAGAVIGYNGTHQQERAAVGSALSFAGMIAPASPRRVAELFVGEWFSGASAPSAGTWRIVFTRTGGSGTIPVDAYIQYNSLDDQNGAVTFTLGATNRRLVGSPGEALRAVTVAAYNTDSGSYVAADGTTQTFPGVFVAPGELLYFSSPGPRTDGVQKPEIAAPGRVFSSLSRSGREDPRFVSSDSAHVVYQGTSMATPHVTGTVALLLAERPSLTPEQVKEALTSSARSDAFTQRSWATGDPGGRPNWSWGYGKLWVPGAIAAVRPSSPLPAAVRAIAADVQRTHETTTSERGTRVPLQSLRIAASDADTLIVQTLSFRVSGSDPAFRLAVAVDTDRDGELDEGEPLVATSAPVAVVPGGSTVTIAVPEGALTVPRGGTLDVVIVGLLSGGSPNGATFLVELLPATSIALGRRSGASVNFAGEWVTGTVARTTLLAADEQLNLTQNPVRRSPLIFNFQPTRSIDIYDFAGRRVRRVTPAVGEVRWEWNLTSENGTPIANGVYVIVTQLQSGAVLRRKLFVAR